MWATIVSCTLMVCLGFMLVLIGNVLYAILEELRDQSEELRALRPRPAPAAPPRAPVRAARTGPPEG